MYFNREVSSIEDLRFVLAHWNGIKRNCKFYKGNEDQKIFMRQKLLNLIENDILICRF